MNRTSPPAGRFITVEGGEGAGKSTNLSLVQTLLQQAGKRVLRTREPGGTHLGEQIRALLLDHREQGMDETAELLLMFAARSEHLQRVILPALSRGEWVLCDRFTDATYAYQSGGRGLDGERVQTLEVLVQGEFRPHLTLLLDLPVETGLERAGRRSAPDRFEQENIGFFQQVRDTYLERAAAEPTRFRIIDAARSLSEVQTQVARVMDDYLELNP